jgi:hypothetical protein
MAEEINYQNPEHIETELAKRGHIVTSWEKIGQVTLEATGVETSSYRIGLPSLDSSPTAELKLTPTPVIIQKLF